MARDDPRQRLEGPRRHRLSARSRRRPGLRRLSRQCAPARRADGRGHRELARLSRRASQAPRLLQDASARPRPITAIRARAPPISPPARPRRCSAACSRATPSAADKELFRAQMLTEMAAMSLDDGLVMQIHPGSLRNHNPTLFAAFGRDTGARHPDPHRLRARAEAAARSLRQSRRSDDHPVHARRDQLFARTRAARGPLSRAAARAALVVLRFAAKA